MYTTENAELKAAYEESLEHLETMKKKKALKVKYWFDVKNSAHHEPLDFY